MRRARFIAAGLVSGLAACHLAEDPDPPTCAPGSHATGSYCTADALSGPVVTIAPAAAGAASCTLSPGSITVDTNGAFRFENQDNVEHVVTGADGQTWVIAKAGQPSSFVGISRPGSWPYTVSGCAGGGTVVVK